MKPKTPGEVATESAAFRAVMKKCPKDIKQFFDTGLKNLKTKNSAEKREFVDAALKGDFNADYFKRIMKVQKIDDFDDTETWLSWKQITDIDGDDLVKMQLKQGKVVARLHKHLDHADPRTKDLPEEARFQYSRVEDTSSNRLSLSLIHI